MLRLILGFVLVLVLAFAASWLADQPGEISLSWGGYQITTSVLVGAVVVGFFVIFFTLLWRSYYWLTGAPGAIGDWFRLRGRRKGYEALSHGLIAAGAGDGSAAMREIAAAERHLGGAPLTLLLKAQTAQLQGNSEAAQTAYKSMLTMPETETLGLRGLFLEAQRTGDLGEALRLAKLAVEKKPSMDWATQGLFELQAAAGDWVQASKTLDLRRRQRHIDKKIEARAKAVILTAQAQIADDAEQSDKALEASLAAIRLAPELVPAAAIAGRILAEKGETSRAVKLVEKTWALAPHPDLAVVYAHARPGDSTHDRLKRARLLGKKTPGAPEAALAIARAAIEAREWDEARAVLKSKDGDEPTRRMCMLMAEIENGEHGNKGGVREWLARAISAPRDPAWTADGHVSERWLAVSPETGAFDVFEWRVPVEGALPPVGPAIQGLALTTGEEPENLLLNVDVAEATDVVATKEADKDASATSVKSTKSATPPKEITTTKEVDAVAMADEKTKPDEPEADPVFIPPIPDDPGVEANNEFGDEATSKGLTTK